MRFRELVLVFLTVLGACAVTAQAGPSRLVSSIEYTRFPFPVSRIPRAQLRELRYRHAELGWGAFDSRDLGNIPILFVDQVYFDPSFQRFVAIKLEAQLKEPGLVNTLIDTPSGQVFHGRLEDGTPIAVFFRNFSLPEAREHLTKIFGLVLRDEARWVGPIKKAVNAFPAALVAGLLIPSAQAETSFPSAIGLGSVCADSSIQNFGAQRSMAGSIGRIVMDLQMPNLDCLVNALKGIWDGSLGGLIDATKKLGDSGLEFVQYAKDHPTLIVTPNALVTEFALSRIQNLAITMKKLFGSLKSAFPKLEKIVLQQPDLVAGFICKLVGTIAPGVLLTALTDGAGAAVLIERTTWFSNVVAKLSLFSEFSEFLESSGDLARIFKAVSNGADVVTRYIERASRLKALGVETWAGRMAACAI